MKWIKKHRLAIGLILLSASLIWTYASLKPETSNKADQSRFLTYSPQYSIIATRGTSIWPEGSTIEQGRASYFYATSPQVKLTPSFKVSGVEDGSISGTLKSTIVLQAVNEKDEVYWSYPLEGGGEQTVSLQGGSLSYLGAPIAIDILAAESKIKEISTELDFNRAVFRIAWTAQIALKGTADDEKFHANLTSMLPITLKEESFTIPAAESSADKVKLTIEDTIQTSSDQGLWNRIGESWVPLFLDILLVFMVAIIVKQKIVESRKESDEHHRFKEWITEGQMDLTNMTIIKVYTLEGLVNLGIDHEKRLVHDSRTKKYCVLDGTIAYVYEPEKKIFAGQGKPMLGKLFLDSKQITPEQLEVGLNYQMMYGSLLGESLVALGFIDEITLQSTLAAQEGLTYLEIDSDKIRISRDWLMDMTLEELKSIQLVPIGIRKDGRLVIACARPVKDELKKSLSRKFKRDLIFVMTRTSSIRSLLEQLEANSTTEQSEKGFNFVNLDEEKRLFAEMYYNGVFDLSRFLKASAMVRPNVLSGIPANTQILRWLINNAFIDVESAHLLSAIKNASEEMDEEARKTNKVPSLVHVLFKAGYLTESDVKKIRKDAPEANPWQRVVIQEAFLATQETLNKAVSLLEQLARLV